MMLEANRIGGRHGLGMTIKSGRIIEAYRGITRHQAALLFIATSVCIPAYNELIEQYRDQDGGSAALLSGPLVRSAVHDAGTAQRWIARASRARSVSSDEATATPSSIPRLPT
jgi:hypothetical protein